jgi:hypothetical protein
MIPACQPKRSARPSAVPAQFTARANDRIGFRHQRSSCYQELWGIYGPLWMALDMWLT